MGVGRLVNRTNHRRDSGEQCTGCTRNNHSSRARSCWPYILPNNVHYHRGRIVHLACAVWRVVLTFITGVVFMRDGEGELVLLGFELVTLVSGVVFIRLGGRGRGRGRRRADGEGSLSS